MVQSGWQHIFRERVFALYTYKPKAADRLTSIQKLMFSQPQGKLEASVFICISVLFSLALHEAGDGTPAILSTPSVFIAQTQFSKNSEYELAVTLK